jgi:nitrate/nitrite transport system permease protein
LPVAGAACVLLARALVSTSVAPGLPIAAQDVAGVARYVLEPFFKDGEMNQGIGRLAVLFTRARRQGMPAGSWRSARRSGSCSGSRRGSTSRSTDRAVHAADLAAGMAAPRPCDLPEVRAGRGLHIALCAMWPTVINTAVGVRSINQEYLNVGRVLKLSRVKMLTRIIVPASLPYVFTGVPALALASRGSSSSPPRC